jgi:hypothetical protein
VTLPDLSKLPFWDTKEVLAGQPGKRNESAAKAGPTRTDAKEVLSAADHETIFRSCIPNLSARPVAGREYRGRCPIHGTPESGDNFSVNFETGRCRCLSRGCVEGYAYEFLAALKGWKLPKDLPKVLSEVRRILGREEPKAAPRKATPSTRTVDSVAVGSVGSAYKSLRIQNASGSPKGCLANVLLDMRLNPNLTGIVGWDAFASKPVIRRKPPFYCRFEIGNEWTEELDVLLVEYLQLQDLMVTTGLVREAVQAIAHENTFHPVRDYLDSLIWDGEPRLDSVLSRYFGALVSEYTVQVGRKWFIGAVARIYKPGCKVDTMLILEGVQGAGKSTGAATMAGSYFTDALGDIRTKEAAEQIQGKWIVEVAELDSLNRAEESAIKAFLSRTSDRYRPAYGRRAVDAPRQCVFVGTTNGEAYLKDVTGGRRFWPVKCGKVDLEALKRDRDQIWAEAVMCYQEGATWWLSDALEGDAREEQAARREEDPWVSMIERWLSARMDGSISTTNVLTSCFEKHKSTCTIVDQKRVAKCLRTLGYKRVRERTDTGLEWVFRREE